MIKPAVLWIALPAIVLLSVPSFAAAKVEVTAEPGFLEGIRSIALMPTMDRTADALCSRKTGSSPHRREPGPQACERIDNKVAKYLSEYESLTVVPPDQVRQTMTELSITTIDEHESRLRLAEALSVDGFLVPILGHFNEETREGGDVMYYNPNIPQDAGDAHLGSGWHTGSGADATSLEANAALILVCAESGEVLMHGEGSGKASDWGGWAGYTLPRASGKVLRKIIHDAFGDPQK